MRIECFLVTRTDRVGRYLRRYVPTYDRPDSHKCTNGYGCDTMFRIEDGPEEPTSDSWDHNDPRWPRKCLVCGYVFQEEDNWQLFTDRLYENAAGWSWPQRELPPGAMLYPSWLQPKEGDILVPKGMTCPTDGSVLMVITPEYADGSGTREWIVDSYSSNCTRPDEVHHCWCRHQRIDEKGQLRVTVNKIPPASDNYGTCSTGAGSIWQHMSSGKGWHGFLEDGWLRQC